MWILKHCSVIPNEYALVNVFEVTYILRVRKSKIVLHTLIFMLPAFRAVFISTVLMLNSCHC